MTVKMPIRGSLDQLINNKYNLYEGNLRAYFQIIFHKAKNLNNPYHNFRHMMHVTWLSYLACKYYSDVLSVNRHPNGATDRHLMEPA